MKQNSKPMELSYYRLSLLSYLKESHPELANNTDFIEIRGDEAAEVYSQTIKNGLSHDYASELANQTLFRGLHFSLFDTLITIIWNEFAKEIPENEASRYALQLLSVCKPLLAKYNIDDDFAYTKAFDVLYTELTGTILIWLEDNGL